MLNLFIVRRAKLHIPIFQKVLSVFFLIYLLSFLLVRYPQHIRRKFGEPLKFVIDLSIYRRSVEAQSIQQLYELFN